MFNLLKPGKSKQVNELDSLTPFSIVALIYYIMFYFTGNTTQLVMYPKDIPVACQSCGTFSLVFFIS